jgi:hypothetical protein
MAVDHSQHDDGFIVDVRSSLGYKRSTNIFNHVAAKDALEVIIPSTSRTLSLQEEQGERKRIIFLRRRRNF